MNEVSKAGISDIAQPKLISQKKRALTFPASVILQGPDANTPITMASSVPRPDARVTLHAATNIMERRYAYVWYYSKPTYACSAMVAMRRLQSLRRKSNSSIPLNVSYVLVFSESGKQAERFCTDCTRKYSRLLSSVHGDTSRCSVLLT